jgi:peptidoglycan/LPS O-acetylase OafA/YrhL
MPQLDALRAFAVGLVFMSHWAIKSGIPGTLGVRLFFVLSGFLITRILLKLRFEIDRHQAMGVAQLRVFYARRFLRLFPALLLLIVVLWLLDWSSIRNTWGWHLSYLSNVYFARRGEYEGAISPLWSLSVEEQFYLVWPILVLFSPRRFHRTASVILVLTAIVWRLGISLNAERGLWTYVLPFNWVDGLGGGSLLAFLWDSGGDARAKFVKITRNVGVPALLVFLVCHWLGVFLFWNAVFLELAATLTFIWLVASAASRFRGPAGRILESEPLLYLGRISYGLYLYHAFAPNAVKSALRYFGVQLTPWDAPKPLYDSVAFITPLHASKVTALIMLMTYGVITVAAASLSWFLWERPLNGLRRYVRYRSVKAAG